MPYVTLLAACGTISDAHMNQSDAADSAIREKLSTYTDPYLARPWARPRRAVSVDCRDGVVNVELVLGFPCADYTAELQAALQKHLEPRLGRVHGWI